MAVLTLIFRATPAPAGGGEMDYILGFFGNRAEEIAGQATSSKQEAIGFHGTRGAITE